MRIRMSRIIALILVFVFVQSFSSSFLISDQGTDVRDVSSGNLTAFANLTVSIYDSSTGGNLLFEEAFPNAIVNGSWNVMINPDLQYGEIYWKDYKINSEDLSFDGNDRLEFQSSVGRVNNASFVNLSLINSCPAGSSIRVIHENGSVECEVDDSGSGSGNYSDTWINSTIDNKISVNNNSIVNWINSIFVSISSLVNRVGNWSADKPNYYNTTQVNNINTSMKNYVDYVNSTNGAGGGGSAYNDSWINQTIYNKTNVNDINTSMKNYVLYVNSTNSGVNGINGLNGTNGINGLNGTNGTNGVNGLNGLNGTNGTNGINGLNGLNGTNGTIGVNGLNGTNGTNGVNGINGLNGTNGTNGINGLNGTNGVNGLNGTNGTNGINGLNGLNGTNGTNGVNGLNGLNGTNGTNGINGLNGTNGSEYNDSWINSTIDNKILINNNSLVNWVNIIFVKLSDVVNQVGNWSADKPNYYNTTQVNNINTSMKNYVDYVNSTNGAGGGSAYNDSWINQTLVSYNGANNNVNLGTNNLTVNYENINGGLTINGNVDMGDTYGSNIIPSASSNFNTDGTGWWAIGGGPAKNWNSTGFMNVTGIAGSSFFLYSSSLLSVGSNYKYTFRVRSNTYNQRLFVYGGTYIGGGYTGFINSTWQTFTGTFPTTNEGTLYIQSTSGLTGDLEIDDISIQIVIPGSTAVPILNLSNGKLYVSYAGNVGINTSSPQQKLHVNGNILANGTINATTDVCIQGGNCLSNLSNAINSIYLVNGTNGVNGLNGLNGTNGTNGINGLNGTNGTNGINGLNGLNGTNGTNGVNGLNGLNGTNGTNGINGLNGTDSINNTNWNNNYSTFLTHTTTTYVDTQNTSQTNYIASNNASVSNYINSNNNSINNYILYVNSTNSAAGGTDTFIANYSTFLNHINWSIAMNGTLMKISQWNSTNTSYMLVSNWNSTNASYLVTETDSKAYNGTLVTISVLNNGSYFNAASTDTFIANYSTFLTHINWSIVMNGTLFKTSQWNSTNTSYMLVSNWNATNNSYYLTTNPYGFYNSTSNIGNWTNDKSNYAMLSILNNGSYFNTASTDTFVANYSQFLLNNVSLTNSIIANNQSVNNYIASNNASLVNILVNYVAVQNASVVNTLVSYIALQNSSIINTFSEFIVGVNDSMKNYVDYVNSTNVGRNGVDGLNGLNGTNGINGLDGTNGTDGYTPIYGIDYINGTNGLDGTNGTDGYTPIYGIDYVNGTNGVNGLNGLNGTNGTNGINGLNGTNGTNGINGINGTDSINNTNWNNNYSTFLTHSTTAYVNTQNSSLVNWVNNIFVKLSEVINQVGNWSADKPNYYNITQLNNGFINNSFKDVLYNEMSTGLISGGILSINATDDSKFDITAGTGIIVNNYQDPLNPTYSKVTWGDMKGIDAEYISSADTTYIFINSTGGIFESVDYPTSEQKRDMINIGWVDHVNRAAIDFALTEPYYVADPLIQFTDFLDAFGSFNVEGNEYSSMGNLSIERSIGQTFEVGSNYINSKASPNVLETDYQPNVEFTYYNRNSSGDWVNDNPLITSIDPNNYDTGYGLSAVPTGNWTIQLISFYAPMYVTDIQYGQEVYGTMEEAEDDINVPIEINPYNVYDTKRTYLIVKQGATNLSNSSQATFLQIGKFGQVSLATTGTNSASGLTWETVTNGTLARSSELNNGSYLNYPWNSTNTSYMTLDNATIQNISIKNYIDYRIATADLHTHNASNITSPIWVNKTGDTMSGNLNMTSNNVTFVNCITFTSGGQICST